MTLEDRIAELEAENTALREQVREQIAWLTMQVQDLQGRLAKDSHNTRSGSRTTRSIASGVPRRPAPLASCRATRASAASQSPPAVPEWFPL
ncbi:MAG: hypothetical protein ACLQUY_28340 [Ktedonobacterales bacterium]